MRRSLAILAAICLPSALAAQNANDSVPALIAKARLQEQVGNINSPPDDNLNTTLDKLMMLAPTASKPERAEIAQLANELSSKLTQADKHESAAPPPPPSSPVATITVRPKDDGQKPADTPELRALYKQGQEDVQLSDIGTARDLYHRAAKEGYPPAALALGQLYDPSYLAKLRIMGGITGNVDKARFWYERADALGDKDAEVFLKGLTNER